MIKPPGSPTLPPPSGRPLAISSLPRLFFVLPIFFSFFCSRCRKLPSAPSLHSLGASVFYLFVDIITTSDADFAIPHSDPGGNHHRISAQAQVPAFWTALPHHSHHFPTSGVADPLWPQLQPFSLAACLIAVDSRGSCSVDWVSFRQKNKDFNPIHPLFHCRCPSAQARQRTAFAPATASHHRPAPSHRIVVGNHPASIPFPSITAPGQ